MDNVSLTYFLDFALKSGTPKLTVVRDFKYRDDYKPQIDFHKPFRDKLIQTVQDGAPISDLEKWSHGVDVKKRVIYRANAIGLRKALGKKPITWFQPPKANHAIGPITLNVNPELGLEIQGTPHVIKLYLKEDELTRYKVQLILHVLEEALAGSNIAPKFGVLDARKGKLHVDCTISPNIGALLSGEAAAFATMYAGL
jgi:hypothetical protein